MVIILQIKELKWQWVLPLWSRTKLRGPALRAEATRLLRVTCTPPHQEWTRARAVRMSCHSFY